MYSLLPQTFFAWQQLPLPLTTSCLNLRFNFESSTASEQLIGSIQNTSFQSVSPNKQATKKEREELRRWAQSSLAYVLLPVFEGRAVTDTHHRSRARSPQSGTALQPWFTPSLASVAQSSTYVNFKICFPAVQLLMWFLQGIVAVIMAIVNCLTCGRGGRKKHTSHV